MAERQSFQLQAMDEGLDFGQHGEESRVLFWQAMVRTQQGDDNGVGVNGGGGGGGGQELLGHRRGFQLGDKVVMLQLGQGLVFVGSAAQVL